MAATVPDTMVCERKKVERVKENESGMELVGHKCEKGKGERERGR